MIPRRPVLLAGLAAPLGALAAETAFQLITPDEARAGAADGGPFRRSLGDTTLPRIEMVEPREAPTIPTPITIRLRFQPAPDAPIDPSSFRATYGALGLDITDRLLRHARLDPAGLVAENAGIPPGTHRITLRVSDRAGRRAERVFRFTVAG